jgi:hypothetical protein
MDREDMLYLGGALVLTAGFITFTFGIITIFRIIGGM